MPGLVPPAGPKPLRRGEGPGIHVLEVEQEDVDGRDKPGHDGMARIFAASIFILHCGKKLAHLAWLGSF
jgi:hypothetical protein